MSGSVIKLPSRFNYSSSGEFNSEIEKAMENPGEIRIDCNALEYIDSAGIGLLVMSQKKVGARGGKLIIENIKNAPREILFLANLQKIIDIR
jgi:anti-anti-sigma factor